uniref:CCR4-NOT transcription complex subunit 2 n=1 Tax=Anabas testudineus TaxID=64144 RepID=A0A7N6B6T2_ANATE
MFGANRKKFMEGGVDSDYTDDSSLYYSQQSMFPPHRNDKDVIKTRAESSLLRKNMFLSVGALGFPMRGLNSNTAPQLSRSGLNQSASQLSSHASTPNTGTMHTPPSPSRYFYWPSMNRGGHNTLYLTSLCSRFSHIHVCFDFISSFYDYTLFCSSDNNPMCLCLCVSMSGFGVNRNPGFSMNNSLSNNIFNGTDGSENVTGLDLSDFPALADRSRRDGGSNPTPLLNPLAGRAPYVGMVTKPSSEQSQDFSIHNEDFPALPGPNYQTKDPTSTNEDSKTNLNSSGKPTSNSDGPKFPGDKSSAPSNNNQHKKGIQVLPDGRVTNIPVGMVTDQFGMIGLLTFIRAAETDPGMVHLALGSDLTTLGLNLNSPENLYPKFASPWASAPCRPQDIDFHVPSEYLTNIHIRDKLAAIKLSRYGEDLLFYLYYMNGGDLLQLLAAVELFNRDWRYHKEERVWITRAPGMEPTLKTNAYERGTYYFFDCLNWRKVAKEFHLEYDKLEERPHVPSTFNYNPAQQAF